ncbi:MAG: ABC transporter permease, partial [Calditrichaeota bacterium]|nr:ABC transporter permease [Calditrichota bacterium]
MFRNYIITAARTLWKNRLFSLVNILGLSVGLAIALVIYLFVSAELSYDKFHVHGDQIYRVLRIGNINGEKYLIGVTSPPYATALETDFPSSVTSAVRVMTSDGQVTYQNHSFREENLFLADANFFEFFSFPLAKGDPATVLSTPNSVVISPEIAKKYFGDADPVGKTLRVDNQYDFTVTGVTAPNNLRSHLNFDMVASLAMFADADWYSNWWNNNLYTYVQIATPTAAAQVEAQLGAFIDKYLGDDFANFGSRIDVTLQPLSEVYFQNDVRYDSVLHGDRGAVMIFAAIALFIL